MNDEKIINHMISFIEGIETDIQAAKLGGDTKTKQKAVNDIIKELEREIKNADSKN